jgi:hypothetical protein
MMPTQPIQFPDGPPLPEMREALLTREDVMALVADWVAHTRVISTLCKAGPHQQTPPGNTPLEIAIERLLERTVSAIQVRYAYDGYEWTDTLLNTPAGIRMVRCQHSSV